MRQPYQHNLRCIPAGVYADAIQRLLPKVFRIDVGTSGKYYPVQTVNQRDYTFRIIDGRDDDRYGAGCGY